MNDVKRISFFMPALAAIISAATCGAAFYHFEGEEIEHLQETIPAVLALAYLAWLQPVVAFIIISIKRYLGEHSRDELAFTAIYYQLSSVGATYLLLSNISAVNDFDGLLAVIFALIVGVFAACAAVLCAYMSMMSLQTDYSAYS